MTAKIGRLDNTGHVESIEVNQQELGTNCWNPSRFLGDGCDMWHDCEYPEKETCKATAGRPATKEMSGQNKTEAESTEIVTCDGCGGEGAVKDMYAFEVYNTPWQDAPETIYFHKVMPDEFKKEYNYDWRESCEELKDDHGWSDFRWFECCECGRMICEQNPSNGWMTQYRYASEDGDMICLKCYESDILKNGIAREKFETGSLAGMFFSGDNHEPYDAGYEDVEDFHNRLVRGEDDAKAVCAKAIELIDSGHKVVLGYESMAIGGLEGYISLFSKESG